MRHFLARLLARQRHGTARSLASYGNFAVGRVGKKGLRNTFGGLSEEDLHLFYPIRLVRHVIAYHLGMTLPDLSFAES